jgi:hypothetical protein
MKYLFEQAPAKWVALIQAAVALAAVFVDGLPQEAVVTLIIAATGLGFHAQKIENEKTYDAFLVDPNFSAPVKKAAVKKAAPKKTVK